MTTVLLCCNSGLGTHLRLVHLSRWEEDTEGVHVDLRQKSLDWLAECFEAAHQSARQAIDYMCNFIGMKVGFQL